MGSFSTFTNAQTNNSTDFTEAEVTDLAEKLEFIYEEATIKDEEGRPISIDVDKVEAKYGPSSELSAIREMQEARETSQNLNKDNEITTGEPFDIGLPFNPINNEKDFKNLEDPITVQTEAVDNCIQDKIVDEWNATFSIAGWTTFFTWIYDGQYDKAAKKLLRVGVKGNLAGIGATIMYFYTSCLWSEEGW